MKKAKQFEIQKVVRRLKQATEAAASAGDVGKLEFQLAAVRGADLDRLAAAAAASVGVAPDGAAMEPATTELPPLERRMVGAKCVVEQLEAMVTAIKAIKAKAERHRPGEGEEGAAPKRQKEDSCSSGGKEEGPSSPLGSEPSSESESEGEPDEAALAALAKLTGARRGDASESSDSGVIEDISDEELEELEQELGGGGSDTSGSDDTDDGQPPKTKGGKGKEAKPKKQPKKSKNRLGQRARRALAEQQHGRSATRHFATKKEEKKEPAKAEELHPSWAARRQQKEKLSISAVAPAGQKIVFDDGSGAKKVIVPAGGGGGRGDRPAKKEKGKSEEGSGLHPSWELRKKQKEAQKLLPAQGTKIVFNDSD